MNSTIQFNHLNFNFHHFQRQFFNSHLQKSVHVTLKHNPVPASFCSNRHFRFLNPRKCGVLRVSGDGDSNAQQPTVSDIDPTDITSSESTDAYVSIFIRNLGLDNDPRDREQAVVALWKYSLGGKKYVDNIMQFRGCVNLTVNLLRSESRTACEAAAGLLRMISSVNVYRDIVAESGAIEEIVALLIRFSSASEVKEQSICTLWNLSVDEKHRVKMINSDLLPLLIKLLDDEDMNIIEAAGGVLANLALSRSNHNVMVEAGVIPKLAKFLTNEVEGSKIIKKEAKNCLLELCNDDYYKILIMEEGLILVPLVGPAAYGSFKPALYSWPSLPDGTEFRRTSKVPSRYGASELLLGLNIKYNDDKVDESKMNAIVGRTQQQFLARIGAIETEDEMMSDVGPTTGPRFTLLPWKDGVARLVLILGLEDESALERAAEFVTVASVNERMRVSFKEAGAVKHLVRLLNHKTDSVKLAAVSALEKLSISNTVRPALEEEGITYPLVFILKDTKSPESVIEKALSILSRVLDPSREMKSKFYEEPVNGSRKATDARAVGNLDMKNLLDSDFIYRLVEILKNSPPSLQRKAASIFEFVTLTEPCLEAVFAVDIESGLVAVFQQNSLRDGGSELDGQELELDTANSEEAGQAISSASRLLTRLLAFETFRNKINSTRFTKLLRSILKSDIPLNCKDWVASCLVKLTTLSSPLENHPVITTEVTIYETIPRLIEKIRTSSSEEETSVVELNRIVSEGEGENVSRAVVAGDGISPLVTVIEKGSQRAVEAGLVILYNLSMDEENHPAILAAGAVPVLRRIVLAERPHWHRALRLLRTLPV